MLWKRERCGNNLTRQQSSLRSIWPITWITMNLHWKLWQREVIGRCFKTLPELAGKCMGFFSCKQFLKHSYTENYHKKYKGLFKKLGLLFLILGYYEKVISIQSRAEEFLQCCCPSHGRESTARGMGSGQAGRGAWGLQLWQDIAFDLVGQGCFSTSAAQEPHHPHTPEACRATSFPSCREGTHLEQWYLLVSFTIYHSLQWG